MSGKQKYRKPEKIVSDFKAICRANGYALAEHGNGRSIRDIDLIAVPWTSKAIQSGSLLKLLADVEGVSYSGSVSGKPHGRIAASYLLVSIKLPDARRWIDLSITPRQGDW